jgi:hypothetical protein
MAWYTSNAEIVDRELPISIDRPFHLNSVVATHVQLLLRSGKLGRYADRVDIVFKDVRAVRIRREFPVLRLRDATEGELVQIGGEVPSALMRGAATYVIEAQPMFAYVVAGAAFMASDHEPDANPSPLLVAETMQGKWPDKILRLK